MLSPRHLEGMDHCPFQVKGISVETFNHAPELIRSLSLDAPTTGSTVKNYTLTIAGWILPNEKVSLHSIEVLSKDHLLKRIKVNVPRPDVAREFNLPASAGDHFGFHCEIGLVGLSKHLDIDIQINCKAQESDELKQVRIGRITAEKESQFNIPSIYQPIQVTAIGRSGTTLLMQILNQHKQILTTNFYPYEIKQAAYWLHFFQVSTAPADLVDSSHPDKFENIRTSIGHNPYNHPEYINQYKSPLTARNFYNNLTINAVAKLCIQQINEYYKIVATEESKPNARYFAEKSLPNHLHAVCTDLFSAPKEIILTRDFRDLLCSARAFNEKRQSQAFGRAEVNDDFEWVESISKQGARRLSEAWKERKNQSLHVKYEDLVLNTESEISRILSYLEVDNSASVVSKIREAVFSTASSISIHQTTKSPQTSVGRWKTDMTEDLKEHCQLKLGNILESFGYEV